ncbi:MAG: PilZ domain-containing protein [Nitrospiraceae bacterium]|nr:PilZ domain-containing protein [Nitrospiraceae bacterium]
MSDLDDYQSTRRFVLQVMNKAGLQVDNTLHELQTSADPGAWARIEGYLKPGMLTGDQRIIELLVAIHPGATGIALRGQPRLRVQFRGLFSVGASMVGGEGFLHDLSHYGCRMESDTSLQPGTELELCFFYGPREAVPIKVELATVRWAKGQEFGVKFLRLQSHEEARLRRVIAELLVDVTR